MNKDKAKQVVKILTESLPFIQKFSKKICVVKYGGAAMVQDELKYSFATDIALMKQVGINVIVVHGGGPQIDKELSKVNIKRNFSVSDLLKKYKLDNKKIAVELNGAIISKINYKIKYLKNNDKLEIVYFIGGG